MESHKIIVSKEDIDRLAVMYGNEDMLDLKALIRHAQKLDEDQYSDYSAQEAFAFWKMFDLGKS